MSINYSAILSRAWNITWKNKILWFFGFLAMLGSGGGARSNPQFSFQLNRPETANLPPEWANFFDQVSKIDINTWINIIVGGVCFLLLLGLGLWILSIIGRGGLIGGIVKADATGAVTFREAWGMGFRYFWRLLLIRLLAFVVGLAIAVVVFLPGAIIGILTCGLGFIPLVCVMVIAGVVMGLWFLLMDYAVVMENQGVGEAIGRAWTILRDHIGPIIIFYLILLALSLGLGIALLVLIAPGAVLIFLSILPLIAASGALNVPLLVIGIVLTVICILLSMLIHAVWTVWEAGVWALAYQEFIHATPPMAVAAV
jgi:flagellar biosynthesis protein FliQ